MQKSPTFNLFLKLILATVDQQLQQYSPRKILGWATFVLSLGAVPSPELFK
jgi:hypothetical protein